MMRRIPPHLPAVLVLGTVSQIAQVLFLRELLMAFQGSELSIGLILAVWLAWVGVGAHAGTRLVARFDRPLLLLRLSAVGVALTLPATILLMRLLRVLFRDLPGTYLTLVDMTVSCLVLMGPVCLLLGAQFVLLSRVWRESDRAQDTSGAGKTYVGEAAGNVLGGILFTFLMVHRLNALQSAVLASMLMAIAILFLSRRTAARPGRLRLAIATLLAVAALVSALLDDLDRWAYRMQWRHFVPQHQLIDTRQSKHGTISVVKLADQYSFYQSGHLVFSTAGPEAASSGLEEQDAVVFAHLAMVQHERPAHILLIGGGLRGVLGEIVRHPVERIDYIELDEMLTRAARPYISPETSAALRDPRVRVVHTDGRLFVKSAGRRYDLIIVDVPDPATAVLNRYYTREFFREAQALLRPDGVFVIGVLSTPDLRGAAVANRNATLYHTLRSAFSLVLVAGERFLFYFATDTPGQISVDAALLQERYRGRNIEAEGFSPVHFHTLLRDTHLRRANWIVRHHGRRHNAHLEGPGGAPLLPGTIAEQVRGEAHLPPVERDHFINSDFRPIGYYYTLMFLDDLTRAGGGATLRRLLHIQSWWILAFLCLPPLAVSMLRMSARRTAKKPDTSVAVLFAVFTTGFSTMALQVALLFSFQSIYGFVYETVGLVVAVFMCGLALGAHLINRHVVNKANIGTLAGVQLIIGLIAGLIAIVLPGAAAVRSPAVVFVLFSALTFVAGFINGVSFPLSAACCLVLNRHPEKSAGSVYAMELVGACVGAVIASVVVAPILGIGACCLMAAMANGTASGVLLISRRT